MTKKKQVQEKDNSVRTLFAIVTILFLVSLSGVMFVKNSAKAKVETEYSNGFTFTKSNGFWHTDIKNAITGQIYDVEFRYSPNEVKDVQVVGNPKYFFKLLELNNLTASYFTFDPEANLSGVNIVAADLAKFMNSIHGLVLVAGCTENETDACAERPIITCENQLDKAMVVYVKESDSPKISLIKNCLTIEGRGPSLIQAQNKLMFLWYGVL
ncbi:MAG TPA: hypothetical protein VKE88_00900 [Candidatus Nanoarchaeia archaeon]|nr:hypothetical protein [Candidatus Nanoarchaeia archaeon]